MTKRETAYHQQARLSFWSFLLELPNFVIIAAAALATNSLITWVDLIDSFGCVSNAALAWLIARKLRHDQKYAYNYGVGKLESISALTCDTVAFVGLMAVAAAAVHEILQPSPPSQLLVFVIAFKVINVLADSFFLLQQYRISKKSSSRLMEAALHEAVRALGFDAMALVALLLCWLLRQFPISWYLSPVLSIVLSVFFAFTTLKRAKTAVGILTDKTLPEQQQFMILRALTACNDGYSELIAVNSHHNGSKIVIDLELNFTDETTYGEIQSFLRDMRLTLEKEMADFDISAVLREEEKACGEDLS